MTSELLRDAVRRRLAEATARGERAVLVRAGDLHTELGDYPDPVRHRMPMLCKAMRALMRPGDEIGKRSGGALGRGRDVPWIG